MLVEVDEALGDAQHRAGLLLARLVVFAPRHLHGLLEVGGRFVEPPVGRVDLAQAVQRVVAHRFEDFLGKLGVPEGLLVLLGCVQVVLEADAAGLQVALRCRSDAEVAHREALCVLRAHAVRVFDGVLVVDGCVLWQIHGLEDEPQVRVRDQSPSAVGQLQVLVVVLDRVVVLAELEAVDAQAVVGERLSLCVLGCDTQRQELLVLLDRLLVHALVV
mmetsp:Transcript_66971/g.131863  ORF Transcript_66971/g.131863 Transcript_66971/m.131863 type:complete len:217 (-) Transcript_66971:518-1168(-)